MRAHEKRLANVAFLDLVFGGAVGGIESARVACHYFEVRVFFGEGADGASLKTFLISLALWTIKMLTTIGYRTYLFQVLRDRLLTQHMETLVDASSSHGSMYIGTGRHPDSLQPILFEHIVKGGKDLDVVVLEELTCPLQLSLVV